VRYTGKPVRKPIGFRIHSNGIRIDFSCDLQKEVAEQLSNYFVHQWSYRYSSQYGSPEFSVRDPEKVGHDLLSPRSVRLLNKRSLFVELPDLVPSMQLHLRMHLTTAEGTEFKTDLFPSVLYLGEHFQAEGLAAQALGEINPGEERERTVWEGGDGDPIVGRVPGVEGVWAIGDLAGAPWLAHKAMHEGVMVAELIAGQEAHATPVTSIPGCTYCYPEIASVGKTERDLKEEGVACKVGKFPYQALGKAQAAAETDGFIKLLFGEEHGELLGAHVIGANATDLIAEMGLGLTLEATIEDFHATIHAHPTLSEGVHEASLDAEGHAIHF
jgi:hypothetical protein